MPFKNPLNSKYSEHRKEILSLKKQDYSNLKIAKHLKKKYGYKGDAVRKYVGLYVRSISEKEKHQAKILVFDIETSPLVGYFWRLWKQNISHKNQLIIDNWMMLTYAAKWLFEEKYIAGRLTPSEVKKENDKRIVLQMWHLLDEADIIIAHNGLKFDVRQLNARFLKHGLTPPSPYQVIDTLKHSRRMFDLASHSLNYIANFLGLGSKIDTGGFELWRRCMNAENKALKEMEAYNIEDVRLLEDVYLMIRPYIKPHPNLGLFIAENAQVCPSCASDELEWSGSYSTYANTFDAFKCKNCGSIGRSRKTSLDKKAKRFLTMSTPK